jgi:hypothetical protein
MKKVKTYFLLFLLKKISFATNSIEANFCYTDEIIGKTPVPTTENKNKF